MLLKKTWWQSTLTENGTIQHVESTVTGTCDGFEFDRDGYEFEKLNVSRYKKLVTIANTLE